jgi:amino acid adenylation domain-containing protein
MNIPFAETIVDAYPLTHMQAAMLFHTRFEDKSSLYKNLYSFEIDCALDQAALQRGIDQAVKRHPVLRTTFEFSDFSEPVQLVHAKQVAHLTVEAPIAGDSETFARQLANWAAARQVDPLSISDGPFVRFFAHPRGSEQFQFTIQAHHALLDGTSAGLLANEIIASVRNSQGSQLAISTGADTGFRDFVELEKKSLAEPGHRAFWDERLKKMPVTTLGHARSDADITKDHFARALPEQLSQQIYELAQDLGVTVKQVHLAAFLRVLSVLANSRHVTTGVLYNSRHAAPTFENTLGNFINVLPLSLSIRHDPWFDLVRQIASAEREVLPHLHFPFSEMSRRKEMASIFETVFIYDDFTEANMSGRLNFDPAATRGFEDTEFPLVARLQRFGSGIKENLVIQCQNGIEGGAVAGMYMGALASMVDAPLDCHADVDIARTDHVAAPDLSAGITTCEGRFLDIFTNIVAQYPERTAVRCGEESITYRALDRRANQLAHHLIASGMGHQDVVGLHMDLSIDYVVSVMAVLKAGGVFLPLDPKDPADRLSETMQAVEAKLVLTRDKVEYSGFSPTRICLADSRSEIAQYSATSPACHVDPADLAYILRTSGSTGNPKAVMITHGALAASLESCATRMDVGMNSVFAATTITTFDISLLEIFLPLTRGASALLLPPQQITDGTIDTEQFNTATHVQGTPSRLRLLLALGWHPRQECHVISGGEALSPSMAENLLAKNVRLHNFYGPTETTIWSSGTRITSSKAIGIGSSLTGERLEVLDVWGQRCPENVTGSLHIAGAGLARGYYGAPGQTAALFRPDPFGAPGQRMYRTGDLATRSNDAILYRGRADRQLKFRGIRVEPREIEMMLESIPEIDQALVTDVAETDETTTLAAYVVTCNARLSETKDETGVNDWRDYLAQRLPRGILPSRFVILPELPVGPRGKVDINQLPRTEYHTTDTPFTPPETPLEQTICEIFSDVLGHEKIGRFDDFFVLNGDSLACLRALSRLERQTGITLPLKSIYEAPTPSSLAVAVTQEQERIGSLKMNTERRTVDALRNLTGHELAEILGDPVVAAALESLTDDDR